MDDDKIVDLYWQRSDQAIKETSSKYGAYCLKISMNILSDIQDSEENVNDTYFHAWNAIPPRRPTGLASFLGKITRNLALNRYKAGRAQKRGAGEFELSLDELDDCIGSEARIDEGIETEALSKSISSFLHEQNVVVRRAFIWRYFYCESVQAISEKLGISQSKVKSMLFRVRNKLRLHLESEGFICEK